MTRLPGVGPGKPTTLIQINGVILDPKRILQREARTEGIVRIISNLKAVFYPEGPRHKEIGLREAFNAITRREVVPGLVVTFSKNRNKHRKVRL